MALILITVVIFVMIILFEGLKICLVNFLIRFNVVGKSSTVEDF